MSNIARSIRLEADRERVRLWQLERKKIAEVERQKRLAEKERQREAEAKATLPEPAPLSLVPSQEHQADQPNANRFRKQRVALIAQFVGLVVIPMIMLCSYLIWVATPLYEVTTVLRFDETDPVLAQSTLPLSSNRAPSSLQQAFEADAFISSVAMSTILAEKSDFVSELSSDAIDPYQRVRPDRWFLPDQSTQLKRFVESSVDVQTGFLTLNIRSTSQRGAVAMAEFVVAEVTDRQASQRALYAASQMDASQANLTSAEQSLREARAALANLQSESGMLDPSQEVERVNARIANLEREVAGLELEIDRNETSGRNIPGQIARLVELRDSLEQDTRALRMGLIEGAPSLMDLSARFQEAELEIDLAERRLDAAYQAMTNARNSTSQQQQVKAIVPITEPVSATYPKPLRSMLSALVVLVAIFFFARLTLFRPRPDLS